MFIERGFKPELKDLVAASDLYHKITGEPEPDVNEAAIVTKFKELAERDYADVLSLHSIAVANKLPIEEILAEYRSLVESIKNAPDENTFTVIKGCQTDLPALRQKFTGIKTQLTPEVITSIHRARMLISKQMVQAYEPCRVDYSRLNEILQPADMFSHIKEIDSLCERITTLFEEHYRKVHEKRSTEYQHEVAEFDTMPEFAGLSEGNKSRIIAVFEEASCPHYLFDTTTLECKTCRASEGQMRSDIDAAASRYDQARALLQEITTPVAPEKQLRRFKLTRSFPPRLEKETDLDEAVEDLRNELQKLIDEGFIIIPE
jgi:hypothetical protein